MEDQDLGARRFDFFFLLGLQRAMSMLGPHSVCVCMCVRVYVCLCVCVCVPLPCPLWSNFPFLVREPLGLDYYPTE